MISLSSAPRPSAFAVAASSHASDLTPEEWTLILEALSAYQHHAGFRAVYEKLAGRQAHAWTTRQEAA